MTVHQKRGPSPPLQLTAADGHVLEAYLALPHGRVRGGLVVIQDAYGIGEYIHGVCHAYAAEGYAAIAPALYDRQRPGAVFGHGGESQAEARDFRAKLVWDDVLLDVAAARAHLTLYGRIGIVGFCVGGSVAWLAGAQLPFAAAVAYYGKDIVDFLDSPPRCPTMLHFGTRDHLITAADIERVRDRYPDLPVHLYPTGHGFDSARTPQDAEQAVLARRRSLDFFRRYVG